MGRTPPQLDWVGPTNYVARDFAGKQAVSLDRGRNSRVVGRTVEVKQGKIPVLVGLRPVNDEEFERRRRRLDEALAERRPQQQADEQQGRKGSAAGYAVALRLSSEFIAGILVGTGIGWLIDRLAGTSPWGLIIFFLLGFCAGVLNVLRSAGLVAEPGTKSADGEGSSGKHE